jgi:hypothetical protein
VPPGAAREAREIAKGVASARALASTKANSFCQDLNIVFSYEL